MLYNDIYPTGPSEPDTQKIINTCSLQLKNIHLTMILELQQHWKKLFSTCPRYYDRCTSPVVTTVIWGIHLRSVAMAYSHWGHDLQPSQTAFDKQSQLGQLDFFNDHLIHITSTVNMVIKIGSDHMTIHLMTSLNSNSNCSHMSRTPCTSWRIWAEEEDKWKRRAKL